MDVMVRRLSTAALLALALALATPGGAAHAGQYHVYSCRTPSGESAPVDGWSGSVAEGSAWDDYALNTCASGGALVAGLGDQTAHGSEIDKATWAFKSPLGTKLSAAVLWRAGYLHGAPEETGTYQLYMTGPDENLGFDECIYQRGCAQLGTFASIFAPLNRVEVPADVLATNLYVNANCGVALKHICQLNPGDANGYAAVIYVYAADVTLEENEAPHVSNVGGELANAPTVQGQSDVAFEASDSGSGVYEALFNVDGQVVQRSVVDSNGGRCRDVGQTTDGLAAFLYVQPCAGSVGADVPLDTTKLANGAHHVVVSAIDAAGNATTVLDRTVTVANPAAPGAPNGTNASAQASLSVHWKGTPKPLRKARFGSVQSIAGRLTSPGGAPIGGATIDVRALRSYAGAVAKQSHLTTTGNGNFAMRIVGGPSQSLSFAYRARDGDAAPVVTRTLTLKVRAGVTLSVAPHTTGVGRSIRFRGRLLGGPIPSGGMPLVLEARSLGSAWIEFKVVRTDARGNFRAAYRFKFPGPAQYLFRARVEPESDFPFAGGSSRVVGVRER